MKTKTITALVLLLGCSQPTSKEKAPSTTNTTPKLHPTSPPTSTPTLQTQPTSLPPSTTTSLPITAASAEPTSTPQSSPANTDHFLVEGAHPNPKIAEQLKCDELTFREKEECRVTLYTNYLYSCLCSGYDGEGNRAGDVDLEYAAQVSLIEGDTIRALELSDIIADNPKLQEDQQEWLDHPFVISLHQGGFKISFYQSGMSFTIGDDAFAASDQSISGDELTKLLRKDGPLTLMEAPQPLPKNFDSPELFKAREITKNPAPSSMPASGELKGGLQWTDKNGENTALLYTQKKTSKDNLKSTTNLYVNHYITKEEATTKLISIFDKQESCEKRNLGEFLGKAKLTDIDRDGIGELSFGYQLGCVDTPEELYPVKVFLIESGAKYALRGDSSGNYKKDKTLLSAPAIFTTYLEWLWTQAK